MADVLQPLIGDCPDQAEPGPAGELVHRLQSCRGMAELITISQDLEKWQESLCDHYLRPVALAQATHAHYLLHLVAAETVAAVQLQIVRQLKALGERGVTSLDCRAAGMGEREATDGLLAAWTQWTVPSDVEYRLEEVGKALLGLEKVFSSMQGGGAPDPRVDAELSTLRALAERLGAQLSAVTQRLQRLESIVDLHGGWTPSAETLAATNKFRVTPPPAIPQSPTITPIAVRPTTRTDAPSPAPPPPGNGTLRS